MVCLDHDTVYTVGIHVCKQPLREFDLVELGPGMHVNIGEQPPVPFGEAGPLDVTFRGDCRNARYRSIGNAARYFQLTDAVSVAEEYPAALILAGAQLELDGSSVEGNLKWTHEQGSGY